MSHASTASRSAVDTPSSPTASSTGPPKTSTCSPTFFGGVQAAAALVTAALVRHGLDVDLVSDTSELGELFAGFERDSVEYEIRRGTAAVRLQLVRFDRGHRPVLMGIGPVLHIKDVIGTKVAAMATRAEPRDFVDVAAALQRYNREQVLNLALRADPALTDEDFTEAMRFLDRVPDRIFHQWATSAAVSELREQFAAWPRP